MCKISTDTNFYQDGKEAEKSTYPKIWKIFGIVWAQKQKLKVISIDKPPVFVILLLVMLN